MKELILVAFHWAHLTATVVWIGGIFFILFIAIPSTKQILAGEAGILMGEISRKFSPMANYCIALLVVTGIVLTVFGERSMGFDFLADGWTIVLALKLLLVLGMIIIHFYRGLVLASRIEKSESPTQRASLQRLSLNLVKTNLVLGMVVLLLSGTISIL